MEPLTTGHWINSSNDLKLALYLVCVAFVCNHSGHVLLPVLLFINADAFSHHLKATVGEDEGDV